MSTIVEVDVAEAKLKELIAGLGPNDEVVIVEKQKPIARLVAPKPGRPQFGSCRGLITAVAEDDEHLKDFVDYMP